MRSRGARWTALGLVGVTALTGAALAACGSTEPSGGAAPSGRLLAVADATSLLRSAPLPRGAAVVPGGDRGAAALQAMSTIATSDLVDLHQAYSIPASTPAPSTWAVPPGSHVVQTGAGNTGMRDVIDAYAPTGELPTRWLEYTETTERNGTTLVRVDALVVWWPAKPRLAVVATGARALRITATSTRGTTIKRSAWRVTDAATIALITGDVDRLRPLLSGAHSCPAERPGTVTVAFLRAGWSHPYAVVRASTSGCQVATVTQYTRDGAMLGVAWLNGYGVSQRLLDALRPRRMASHDLVAPATALPAGLRRAPTICASAARDHFSGLHVIASFRLTASELARWYFPWAPVLDREPPNSRWTTCYVAGKYAMVSYGPRGAGPGATHALWVLTRDGNRWMGFGGAFVFKPGRTPKH